MKRQGFLRRMLMGLLRKLCGIGAELWLVIEPILRDRAMQLSIRLIPLAEQIVSDLMGRDDLSGREKAALAAEELKKEAIAQGRLLTLEVSQRALNRAVELALLRLSPEDRGKGQDNL